MRLYIKILFCVVCIGAFIFAFSWSGQYLTSLSDTLTGEVDRAIACAEEENWAEAESILQQLEDKWHDAQQVVSLMLEHQALDSIDSFVEMARVDATTKDFESFCRNAENIKHQMQHIVEAEELSWSNIL